jgi:hypothetical protein
MLYESYSNKALSKRTYKWHEHFQSRRISTDDDDDDDGDDNDDDERVGQIWILRSSSLIAQEKNSNHVHHQLTAQEIAEETGISIFSCHITLTQDLVMHQCQKNLCNGS